MNNIFVLRAKISSASERSRPTPTPSAPDPNFTENRRRWHMTRKRMTGAATTPPRIALALPLHHFCCTSSVCLVACMCNIKARRATRWRLTMVRVRGRADRDTVCLVTWSAREKGARATHPRATFMHRITKFKCSQLFFHTSSFTTRSPLYSTSLHSRLFYFSPTTNLNFKVTGEKERWSRSGMLSLSH